MASACSQCRLPFPSPEELAEHAKRSGHAAAPAPSFKLERCTCGQVLIAAVSLDSLACSACRWDARKELEPSALRLLAGSYRRKGMELQAAEKEPQAQDYFSEARALEDEALEREGVRHG